MQSINLLRLIRVEGRNMRWLQRHTLGQNECQGSSVHSVGEGVSLHSDKQSGRASNKVRRR
jgi:hypothetical protein